MNKYYSVLTALLLLSFFNANWVPFTSVDGKFTVNSPGAFVEKVNGVETKIGNLEYHTFLHEANDDTPDNLIYMVSYVDYPEGSIHSDSTDLLKDFFEVTVESSVESVNGELFYSSDIQLGQYPGKLWRVVYKDGEASIRTKAYLVKNRFYSVQTITLKDKSLNPSIDKFMDSFKVLE